MMNEVKVINQRVNNNFAIYNGDSTEVLKGIPDESLGYSIFSPPFSELYVYSDNARDVSNCKDDSEFWDHFKYLIKELNRVMMSGRNISVHCMDLPRVKGKEGFIGIKDFSGDVIRAFENEGFIYHSRVTIWKDPLVENMRTRALGLAYKQIVKDSSMCRQGLPDYVITFRKKGDNLEYIGNPDGIGKYQGKPEEEPLSTGLKYNHEVWQKYASPVWMDIRLGNNLNAKNAKGKLDEKHLTPTNLDVIHRCIDLWSNKGDIVFSPFMGIGSEGYKAIELGRKFIGIELKESYFNEACYNLEKSVDLAEETQKDLFS